jgi:ElaB/YqjD/DUF883 family membrane-anchored ribosome-binding protein
MDDEPEVIRSQMEETRSSLTDKIERLEQTVTDKVQSTTAAVTNTVESVKDAVHDTVESVKDSVTGTVDSVKTTLSNTVDTVKEAFDIRRYVEEYPWASFGAAVGVGFVGGLVLGTGAHARGDRITGLSSRGEAFRGGRATGYAGNGHSPAAAAQAASFDTAPAHAEPGWMADVSNRFGGELGKLKGVALGALFGFARDWIAKSSPPQVATRIGEVIDDVTRKLGGEPLKGGLLDSFSGLGGKSSRERDATAEARPTRAAASP